MQCSVDCKIQAGFYYCGRLLVTVPFMSGISERGNCSTKIKKSIAKEFKTFEQYKGNKGKTNQKHARKTVFMRQTLCYICTFFERDSGVKMGQRRIE